MVCRASFGRVGLFALRMVDLCMVICVVDVGLGLLFGWFFNLLPASEICV